MNVVSVGGEPVTQDLLETLETAVAHAAENSSLGIDRHVVAVVLRGWASAFYAVEKLRRGQPSVGVDSHLAIETGYDAALERIDAIVTNDSLR